MRTISQFAFRFVTIRSRITATLITLSLLVGFTLWSLGRDAKGKAAAMPPMAANSGFLYVLNNCIGCANRIFGFAVDETTGALTSVGIPISTGGNGFGNSITSELLTIDRKNLRLFAINGGSNTVTAYAINPATGALTALQFSPINLSSGTWSTIAVHSSDSNSMLVIGDSGQDQTVGDGRLASFKVTATTATPPADSPFFSTGEVKPLSAAFSQDGAFVYTGGGGGNVGSAEEPKIAGFNSTDAGGVLTAISGSPFVSGSFRASAYATDATGRLFVVNRNSSQPRVFTTANAGAPLLADAFMAASGVSNAGQGVLHPNDRFYLVSEIGGSHVSVFQINDSGNATTLTKVNGSPFLSGGTKVRLLALNQSGNFLFAANDAQRKLTTFTVAPAGTLTIQVTQPDNTLGITGTLSGIAYLPPFTTTTTIAAPPITCGQDGIVTVTVSSAAGNPTGNLTLTVDGGAPMTKALSGGSATFNLGVLTVGNHTLVATFPAQGGFAASSNTRTLVVKVNPTTTTIVPPPAIACGQDGSVIVTVTSTFGTPTGNVTLTVDGGAPMTQPLSGGSATFPINAPTVGNHPLVATFPAQGCFALSSDTDKLRVKLAPTSTTINAPAIISGLSAFVIITVSSPFGTPSGEVKLKVDGVERPPQTLIDGSTTFDLGVLTVGIHLLVATFPAQGCFALSSDTDKLRVKPAKPTITKIFAPDVTVVFPSIGQTAPVIVTVKSIPPFSQTPSGNVSLKLDNGTAVTQPLSGGSATFNLVMPAVGLHFLKATFLGQPGVFAPSSATGILRVKAAAGPRETRTKINAPTITQRIPAFGQTASVIVTVRTESSPFVTPSGTVSLEVDGGAPMTKVLSGGTATFIINTPTAGNHSLVARFNGPASFAPSNAIGTLVVNKPTGEVTKP